MSRLQDTNESISASSSSPLSSYESSEPSSIEEPRERRRRARTRTRSTSAEASDRRPLAPEEIPSEHGSSNVLSAGDSAPLESASDLSEASTLARPVGSHDDSEEDSEEERAYDDSASSDEASATENASGEKSSQHSSDSDSEEDESQGDASEPDDGSSAEAEAEPDAESEVEPVRAVGTRLTEPRRGRGRSGSERSGSARSGSARSGSARSGSARSSDRGSADHRSSDSERRAAEAEERLPFGELAVLEEMVTREALNQLLYQQRDRRENEHKNVRIGTLLVREGLLTKKQAKRLLKIQRQSGPIVGFQLLEHLGSGGMGSVFRAIEEETGYELALKILPPRATRDTRYRTRFLREATLLSQLDHPHLVRCYSHGEANGHLYFAMEYVPGMTGRALIKRDGAFSEKQLRKSMRQVLEAMTNYWRELIVHRDIKPENILFTDDLEAKLADLGLSRQLDDDVHITTVGKTLGTPLYISPEMARGRQDIDIRADLYSLGATFYHLGTGVPPFTGTSQAELLKAHVEDTVLRPRLKNARMSEGMETILLRLLEKKPCDRFAGPSDALAALDRLEAGEDPCPDRPRRKRSFSGAERNLSNGAPRKKGRLASSATRTGAGNPRPPARREGELPRYTPIAAGVVFLALFGVGVLLGSQKQSTAAPNNEAAHAEEEAQADFLSQVAKDPDAAAVAALAWCDAHPEELGEQVVRLELVDGVLPESAPQRHALRLRLLQARELLADEAQQALDGLRNKLISLVEAKRHDDARRALDEFPAAYLKNAEVKEAHEELRREFEALLNDGSY